jgi:hypothetical protein
VIDSIATAWGWRVTIFPALAVYVCDPMPTPERFISPTRGVQPTLMCPIKQKWPATASTPLAKAQGVNN